jgi:hypothetical protein
VDRILNRAFLTPGECDISLAYDLRPGFICVTEAKSPVKHIKNLYLFSGPRGGGKKDLKSSERISVDNLGLS